MTLFLDPPPAPPTSATGTFAWLRASVARFSSGAVHARRRRIVEDLLAQVDPAALRAAILRRPVGADFARRAPVAVLAEALGARDDVTDAVITVAQGYPTGEAPPGADEAVALLARQWGTGEVAANRIGLLVQTCAATAALIRSSAARPISRTLEEDPPVRATRRVAADGSIVSADLTGHPFGAGPHACPGRDHALALAEGAVRALRKERFAALHRPLLLPNAWDHASAAALAAAGFRAIGTTSLGVAAAAGLPDGAGATRDETVRLAERLVGLPSLLTVDIEAGFGDEPAEIAALTEELAALGVAGVNIEDNVGDVARQRELITAAATSGLFVNARTDTHWLRPPGIDPDREAISRIQSYVDAGADGVFVPGVREEKVIAELVAAVGVPVNVLYSPGGPSFARLTELGVGRVSCGSLLFRVALDAAVRAAEAVAAGEPVPADVVSYSEVASRASAAARSVPPSRGNRP